jgi:hypothetical protein
VQAKLKIGQPGDKYEQEADRVAEEVMRMPEPHFQRQLEPEEEEGLLQAKQVAEQITPLLQRQVEEEEEEELLQAKEISSQTPEVNSSVESNLNSVRSDGQPLPSSVRGYFEPRFGYDLSHVRVHTTAKAAESARAVNAQAYTLGRDIIFGNGHYSPETSSGRQLLAHELTHVVQQNKNSNESTMINIDISTAKETRIQRRVRFFVCNSADRANINNAISMSVIPGALRSAVDTASDKAAAWAYNAVALLRMSPRSADTRSAFRDAFGANPEWVPPWFATLGARWIDFGDLIAQRLQRGADILSEGWIQYYCWGSPTRCPECTNPPSTYYACSSYLGRYLICLGRHFWELWAARNTGDMATTLLHEALHIYFRTTVAHRGRQGNAACYEKFIYEINGHPIHPETAAACPT